MFYHNVFLDPKKARSTAGSNSMDLIDFTQDLQINGNLSFIFI